MKQYWPMAEQKNGERLFTYQYYPNIEDAMLVFRAWENRFYNYHLSKMWIDVKDSEDPDYECRLTVGKKYYILDDEIEDDSVNRLKQLAKEMDIVLDDHDIEMFKDYKKRLEEALAKEVQNDTIAKNETSQF